MRAAVIGCGVIAPMHVGSIAAAGGEVVQLCDIDTDKAARLRAAHCPGAEITADFDETLSRNPDVVHICTPHYLHAGMAEAALRRGINVFVEKPLCISVAELERISEAAARSSAQLGVCFQNRFTPAAAEAKRLAASVTAGYCSVQWKRDAAYYASAGWRGKKATEGGGVLINQAIHTLDLLLWLIGEPRFVTANVSNRTHAGVIDVEDTAEGLIEFDNCSAPFYATVSAAGSRSADRGRARAPVFGRGAVRRRQARRSAGAADAARQGVLGIGASDHHPGVLRLRAVRPAFSGGRAGGRAHRAASGCDIPLEGKEDTGTMKMTFRWFGESDSIPLAYIRQIPGMTGVVTAVYDCPPGEKWSEKSVARLKKAVNDAGLAMEVIESVPVHEDIKLGKP